MRFTGSLDSRIARDVSIKKARELLFGHEKGLPGERWLARPLVAKDMLHWYMPSKYGLQDFRLDEYYEMQAERFKKRQVQPWVHKFKSLMDTIQANKEKLSVYIHSVKEDDMRKSDAHQSLNSMLGLLQDGNSLSIRSPENRESRVLQLSLLRQRHAEKRGESSADPKSLFVNKRHRFVDPLFRRRRLKWMERFLAGMNNSKEIKYNRHFTRHPDDQKAFPSNLGSVTVRWPNRRN
jgi:hypothetical protein